MLSRNFLRVHSSRRIVVSNLRKQSILVNLGFNIRHLNTDASSDSTTRTDSIGSETSDDIPWYLRDDESSKLDTPIFKAVMPDLPTESPEALKATIEHMIQTLGLDKFKVFDIRDREDLPISSSSDIMVICQGKSEKHVQNAAQELMTFLKHQYDTQPFIEGLIKPNSLIRMRRRMKRRLINSRRSERDGEFGLGPNSWVMIDTQISNIFIHILTPERRESVNLEYMWCKPEDRELYEPKTDFYASNSNYKLDNDSIFSSIYKRSYSTSRHFELHDLAIQQLKTGDLESFLDAAENIRNDTDIATKTLEGILNDLNTRNLTDVLSNNGELHSEFFNQSFPLSPTSENWEQRFKFLSILHLILPERVPLDDINNSLYLQSEAGETLTKNNLIRYIELLRRSPYHSEEEVSTSKTLNIEVHKKGKYLIEILSLYDINNKEAFDKDVALEILRLFTQESKFDALDHEIPVSGIFKSLVQLFQDKQSDSDVVEFILTTYLKANDPESFFKYWSSLNSIQESQSLISLDNRPWGLLFEILDKNYKENFAEIFVHDHLPQLLYLIPLDSQQNTQILSILNKFDQQGDQYKNIRDSLIGAN